jgi:hypothetical protein
MGENIIVNIIRSNKVIKDTTCFFVQFQLLRCFLKLGFRFLVTSLLFSEQSIQIDKQ